jgi:hypothetical protein
VDLEYKTEGWEQLRGLRTSLQSWFGIHADHVNTTQAIRVSTPGIWL